MLKDNIDFSKVEVKPLTRITSGINSFKNRKKNMVNYIQKIALQDQDQKLGTTWVWVYDNKIVLGFISIAMYSIDKKNILKEDGGKSKKYNYQTVPSLLVGQLATHEEYECNEIAQSMIKWAIREAVNYSKFIGCRTVALHPHKDVIEFYKKKCFFKHIKTEDDKDIMYFNLLEKS